MKTPTERLLIQAIAKKKNELMRCHSIQSMTGENTSRYSSYIKKELIDYQKELDHIRIRKQAEKVIKNIDNE